METKTETCANFINSINCLTHLLNSEGLQLNGSEKNDIKTYILEHAAALSRLNVPHIFNDESEN